MAYITFIARKDLASSYRLTSSVVLGRAMDCGVFVPDVFVSRHHCRFEPTDKGWVLEDLSRNGIFYRRRRVKRRILHEGDVIELGTIAFVFHEGELQDQRSMPAPFGSGPSVISLVDTLFTDGKRPSEYLKKNRQAPAWERPLPLPVDGGDWTELDLELQIEAGTIHQRSYTMTPLLQYLEQNEWTELDIELTEGFVPLVPVTVVAAASEQRTEPSVPVETSQDAEGQSDLVSLEEAAAMPDNTDYPENEPHYASTGNSTAHTNGNTTGSSPVLPRPRPVRRPPPSYNADKGFSGGGGGEPVTAASPANRWEKVMGVQFDDAGQPSSDRGGKKAKAKGSVSTDSSFLERMKDHLATLRKIDARDIVDGAKARPLRFTAIAAITLLTVGVGFTATARFIHSRPSVYVGDPSDYAGKQTPGQ